VAILYLGYHGNGRHFEFSSTLMVAIAMVTKVQNGHQIQKSSDLGEIWFPSRL
jgi:hypothetical protein